MPLNVYDKPLIIRIDLVLQHYIELQQEVTSNCLAKLIIQSLRANGTTLGVLNPINVKVQDQTSLSLCDMVSKV